MTTDHSLDWVSAQTMLLADKRLRASFRTDPVAIARELKIRPPEIALFVAMNPDQLDAQADILVQKRFHEVGKWLPLTFNALGEQAGIEFIAYSATFWPESHRRHLLDAARFARHLKERNCGGLVASEHNWVEFMLRPKKMRVRPVILPRPKGKKRPAVQIMTRFGGRPTQRFLFLA